MKLRTKFVPFSELKDDVPVEQWPDNIRRASGQVLCSCGIAFDEHYQPAKFSCPTIVEDCDGNWWKL